MNHGCIPIKIWIYHWVNPTGRLTHLNTDVGWSSTMIPSWLHPMIEKSNIPIIAYSWWFFYQFNPMIIPSLFHDYPMKTQWKSHERKSNESATIKHIVNMGRLWHCKNIAKQSPTGCPHIPWWLLLSLPLWENYSRGHPRSRFMPLPADRQIAQNPHHSWGLSACYSPKCIYTPRSKICLILSNFLLR